MDSFIHDAAFQWGGAERVFGQMVDMAPAPPQVLFIGGEASYAADALPLVHTRCVYPQFHSSAAFRIATPWMALRLPRRKPIEGRVSYSSYAVARWLPSTGPRFIYNHAPMRQIWHGAGLYNQGLHPEAVGLRALAPWLRAVDRKAGREDDYVVAPSPRVAHLLDHHLGVRVRRIVPPPAQDHLFASELQPDLGYFIWVGRVVEPVKRLAFLFHLFRARPHDRLIVVGDGRSLSAAEAEAPSNVRFVGWLTGAQKAAAMAGARALVLPSSEDFGLCAAESMALGVPVVVTEAAGISDWVRSGESGLLPEFNSENSWHEALDRARSLPRGQVVRKNAQAFALGQFRRSIRKCWGDLGWLN